MDHEVAEVWDAVERRWRLVDPELGDALVGASDIRFDPADVPRDGFIVEGLAREACRGGRAEPETFLVDPDLEIEATRGWPYLLHNLLHDLAAPNKTGLLLWDFWGLIQLKPSDEELPLPDEAAEPARARDDLHRLRGIFETPGFEVPSVVKSYSPALGTREVRLTS